MAEPIEGTHVTGTSKRLEETRFRGEAVLGLLRQVQLLVIRRYETLHVSVLGWLLVIEKSLD